MNVDVEIINSNYAENNTVIVRKFADYNLLCGE